MFRIKIWQSDRKYVKFQLIITLWCLSLSATVEQEHTLKANFPGVNVPATTVLLAKRRPIEKKFLKNASHYVKIHTKLQATHTHTKKKKKDMLARKKKSPEHAIYASDFNVP